MNRLLLILFLLVSGIVSAQHITTSSAKKNVPASLQQVISTTNHSWTEKESYINGFARVLANNKFSFVDLQDSLIAPLRFDDVRNFSKSLAAVNNDGKWGFIDEHGKTIIACQYEIVYDFKDSVTAVYKNKKWSLINRKGIILHSPDISVCYGFNNGIAKIEKDNKTGIMNTAGDITYTGEIKKAAIKNRYAAPVNNSAIQCPENIDFEDGDFGYWNCFTGTVDSVGNTNVITVFPSAPNPLRHKIISRNLPALIDPYGMFPLNPPDGSNFAVKLGNTRIGAEAERIQYKITVPSNDSDFSIRYDYAVVFQDPGHTSWTQPRFTSKLFDSAANAYIDCASFEYISTSSLPGFAISTVDTSVIYKPWATAFISLRGQAGKTLYLEFTTADCVRRGHWGYAYVDVESACAHAIDINYECTTGIATLNGPPGFQFYNWWNQDYTAILATGQNAILNPAPQVNSFIWLEMIPFSDFGCRDSLPVQIRGSFSPHFDVSERVAICAPHRFTFYNNNVPAASAIWNFGDGTNGTGDTVSHIYSSPGTYIVTLNVTLPGGCNGIFQDTVKIIQPTGSFNYNGGSFCGSHSVNFNAITSNIDSLRWDFGDGTIITNTLLNINHTYSLPGIYIPNLTLISNEGCRINLPGIDTIKIEALVAGLSFIQQKNCGNTSVSFSDTSHSYFGITSYAWNFGDGTTATGNPVNHIYSSTGNYAVQLIITGASGCRDTITTTINILVNSIPVASIAGPVSECALVPVTFNNTSQSTDAISSAQWISSDGSTGSGNSFNVTFTQSGNYTIQLITGTVNGCFDTATHIINIKPLADLTQPADVSACDGSSVAAVIFSGSLTGTNYTWTNDNPSIGLPVGGSGNLPSFIAVNGGAGSAVANITVTANANGCPGQTKTFTITVFPLPTGFQPPDQTVCARMMTAAVIFTSFTSSVNSANYTWTNDQPGIGLPSSGVGNIPSFSAVNNGTTPVNATITISVSNNGCQGVPKTFTITVNPIPVVNIPANQSVCSGVQTSELIFTGSIGNTVYNWSNDQTSIGLAANGADSIPGFIAVNNGTAPVTANIIVTPVVNGCSGTPGTFAINVNPTPTVSQPPNQDLCNGNATTIIHFTGTVAGTTFNWINDLPAINLAASGSGDIVSFIPSNNNTTNITATITVTPAANGCEGTPKNFTITVFPTASMVQPFNQFQCNGETTPAMIFSGPVAGTTYTWTNSLPSIGLAASGSGNIPSFITTNAGNASVTATITVTPSMNNCAGIPKTFTITVDPTPDISQPASQTLCNRDTALATNFSATVSGTVFTWINSASSIGLAPNGSGNIPAFTAVNNTHFPVTAIISVTGTSNSCGSVVKVFTVTVNPSPDVDVPDNRAICNGATSALIPLTGPVAGATYSWKNNDPSIGLAAIGVGDIPSFIAINHGNSPVIATITVTGTYNNCGSISNTFTITVNPTPSIHANDNLNVCLGSTVQLLATGAATYSWSPAAGLSCTDCANPSVTPTDTTSYHVQGTSAEGCSGVDSIMLIVRMPFEMIVPPNDTVCSGISRNLKAMNANTYLWSPPDGLNRTDIAEPTATPTATTHYRVIGYDAFGCFTDTGYVTIVVGPKPAVNIGNDITTTSGAPVTFHPEIQNGPIIHYTWTPAAGLSCSDCATPTAIIKNNETFTLTVENSFGCFATDNIVVNAFCQKSEVFVPNAFTPDGDGLNDILMIRGSGITVKSYRIFNRWGEVIFEKLNFSPNDPKYGWDGKIRGVPATPDVYVYTAEVICDNGTVYTYKGNTTILK